MELGVKGIEDLLRKLQHVGFSFEKYTNGQMYRGVVTGCNQAFVIDEKIKNHLIEQDRKCGEVIKPFYYR